MAATHSPVTAAWFGAWLDATGASRPDRSAVANHVLPVVGQVPLHVLRPEHVRAVLDAAAARLRPSSAGLVRTVLAGGLRAAEGAGHVPPGRCAELLPPRPPAPGGTAEPVLDPRQVRRLLARIRAADPAWVRWALVAVLGLTLTEVDGLGWPDLHDDPAAGGPVLRVGARTVPLPDALAAELAAWRGRQEQMRALAPATWQETGLTFTDRDGRALPAHAERRALKAHLSAAGLPACTPRQLRQAAGLNMRTVGLQRREVMALLGIVSNANARRQLGPAAGPGPAEMLSALVAVGLPD